MFFASKLIGAIKKDHDKLRDCCDVLKNEDSKGSELRASFLSLLPEMRNHTDSEERVVYRFMLNNPNLKSMAVEALEEHSAMEQLLSEFGLEIGALDKKWRAKAMIMAEMIEHHINGEELQILPTLKRHLSAETDEKMYRRYDSLSSDCRSSDPLGASFNLKSDLLT